MAETFLSANQPPLNQSDTTTRFKGQTVIVTGGASGIGRAVVERFLNDGGNVAVFDINDKAGEELLKWAKDNNSEIMFRKVDVTDRSQCETGVAELMEKYGGQLHHLINSVAYFGSKGLGSTKKDWDKTLSVNVVGYVNMVQACHPYMKNLGGSSIVNVASISGYRAQPSRWTYSASKGAVLTLTKCMALDLSADGIRVNSVSPAWIWSPECAKGVNGMRDKAEMDAIVTNFHMLRRPGETSEVAAAITFLCSRDASFITGTDLKVDGGYTAMGPEQHGQDSEFAGSLYQ